MSAVKPPSRTRCGGSSAGTCGDPAALHEEIERLTRINQALMNRVERGMDLQEDAFSLFETATALESQVRERTAALERAIEESERANHELVAAKEAADAASRAKSEFLAMMSHEIRTPMNGVVGMVQLLAMTELTDRQQHLLSAIRYSATALLVIINDTLDFSKIEAGRLELEATPFDVVGLLKDTVAFAEEQALAKGLSLSLTTSGVPTRHVIGDPGRLRQVLLNLIGNAIKFTEQGKVEVVVTLLASDVDEINLGFEVRDTGVGIAPELHKRIFEPFRQADGSTTRRYGGTGLGLSITNTLVELMGGRMSLRSELGQGATFSFSLRFPLAPPHVNAAGAGNHARLLGNDATLPSSALGGTGEVGGASIAAAANGAAVKRILVAEDNRVNQEVARDMLGFMGYQVEVVENGHLALERLAHAHFDLVLMDCQMPVMDGFATTRAIRQREHARPDARRIPIIAVTAGAVKGDRELCLSQGMDDYLAKPLDFDHLRNLLEHWLAEDQVPTTT